MWPVLKSLGAAQVLAGADVVRVGQAIAAKKDEGRAALFWRYLERAAC